MRKKRDEEAEVSYVFQVVCQENDLERKAWNQAKQLEGILALECSWQVPMCGSAVFLQVVHRIANRTRGWR